MKRRRFLWAVCVALAVLGVANIFTALAESGKVSAFAVDNTVTLTSAQTLALFGQSIEVSYSTTGEGGNVSYSSAVAVYNNTAPYSGAGVYYSPDGQVFSGREFLLYRCTLPDISIRPDAIAINVKTSVDISDVSYIDTAICTWADSDFDVNSVLYGSRQGYWHCSDGDHYALHQGAYGTEAYNYYGYLPYQTWNMIPFAVCSFPESSFSFGWWSTNLIDQHQDGNYYFALFCPIMSADWIYSGNDGAGQGGESSGGGGDSGGGSTDLSPVVSRLDTIIEKLDAIAEGQQADDDDAPVDIDQPYDDPPASFDADAAFSGAMPAMDMPFLSADSNPGGGQGMEIEPPRADVPAIPTAPEVQTGDFSGGMSVWWYLLSRVITALPIISKLIIAAIALNIAVHFLFRE